MLWLAQDLTGEGEGGTLNRLWQRHLATRPIRDYNIREWHPDTFFLTVRAVQNSGLHVLASGPLTPSGFSLCCAPGRHCRLQHPRPRQPRRVPQQGRRVRWRRLGLPPGSKGVARQPPWAGERGCSLRLPRSVLADEHRRRVVAQRSAGGGPALDPVLAVAVPDEGGARGDFPGACFDAASLAPFCRLAICVSRPPLCWNTRRKSC